MSDLLGDALKDIPAALRNPLVRDFEELLTEYRAGDWEKVGLKAGKICETAYTILDGFTAGTYASGPSKPKNMVTACVALEKSGSQFSRSVRIQIPRVLIALYELRNNRAIGHVSSELSPNHMDAEFFVRSSKWIMAEFIREFTKMPPDQAREIIEQVTDRTIPVIWDTGKGKRILDVKRGAEDKALIATYGARGSVKASEICRWIGYSNLSRFRASILKGLHDQGLIDFDVSSDQVQISPTGIRKVESTGMLELPNS